jgi:hypothetical protein
LNPLQRCDLVHKAVVTNHPIDVLLRELLKREEAETAEAIVGAHKVGERSGSVETRIDRRPTMRWLPNRRQPQPTQAVAIFEFPGCRAGIRPLIGIVRIQFIRGRLRRHLIAGRPNRPASVHAPCSYL